MDIVFRYLELCVWVFALNRRTRRKTRGLLRPRGLSYQIDAPRERLRVGTGMGLKASIIFQRPFIGRRALQQAQSLVAPLRSPREHGTSQLVWDWLVLATGTRSSRTLVDLSFSLLVRPFSSSLPFAAPRINQRITSWRFYFLNKGWVFISYSSASPLQPPPPPLYTTGPGDLAARYRRSSRDTKASASRGPRSSRRAIGIQDPMLLPTSSPPLRFIVGASFESWSFLTGYSGARCCFVSASLRSKYVGTRTSSRLFHEDIVAGCKR